MSKNKKEEEIKNTAKTLEVVAEPNEATLKDNNRVYRRKADKYPIGYLPDHKLSLVEFKSRISTLLPKDVITEFRVLFSENLLLSPRACIIELKRLGYSTDLAENNIELSNPDEKE